jgi:hypothetical protein
MNVHLSFEIPQIFVEYSLAKDYNSAMELVNDCFDRFPKEEDSITKIVLTTLRDEVKDENSKLFFEYLLKHLELLYLEWLRAQA